VSRRVAVVLLCHLFWDKVMAFREVCLLVVYMFHCYATYFTYQAVAILSLYTFCFDIGDQLIIFCYSPVYVVSVYCP